MNGTIIMVPDDEGYAMPLVSHERRIAEIGRLFLGRIDAPTGARLVRFTEAEVIECS
jgi:hypothetical protein